MKKYVFFIDIDETLMTKGKIPEENILSIGKARSAGHAVFINTGRSVGFVPKWLTKTLETDGISAASGAYIRIGDKVIISEYIKDELVLKSLRFLINGKRSGQLEGRTDVIGYDFGKAPTPSSPEEFMSAFPGYITEKIIIWGRLSPAEMRYFSTFYTVVQNETYAECSVKGFSKGSSVERIMQYYPGFTSVAIGDSPNDIDMFYTADISVAMGNASDSIKHICTYETDTVENAGVAKAIDRLTEGESI